MATFANGAKQLITRRTFDMIFTPEEIYGAFLSSDPSTRTYPQRAITVYSGVQPTAQQVEANWLNYKSSNSNCLAHYSGSVAPTFTYNSGTLTYYFTNTSNAITATALNSGSATWAIIWMATTVDISLTSIPALSRFVVVPVTTNSGTGIIRYVSVTATQGQAFVPYDGGLTISEV